jgi:MFS family permease
VALGAAAGYNIANLGPAADVLASHYDVRLGAIGFLTTALFVTHLAMQIPGGRAADRFGARRTALVGLVIVIAFNALALIAPEPALAIVARALIGIGTGLGFIAGSAYVRESGGSPFAQGLFGGVGLAGGGLALAVVSQLDGWLGWRAPYWTALVIGAAGLVVLAAAPPDPRGVRAERDVDVPAGVLRDRRLYRLAGLYGASLGLSLVVGNWVVELLERNGGVEKGTAGAVGAFTLLLGVVTRPLGGWILRERSAVMRACVAGSLAAGAAGTALLAIAEPLAVAALGAVLIGLAAGIPFAPAFTGAALVRPDAPGAAVGMVNGAASLVVIVGTPLLGLTFRLPGDGRIGFIVVAVLWVLALALLPTEREMGVRTS